MRFSMQLNLRQFYSAVRELSVTDDNDGSLLWRGFRARVEAGGSGGNGGLSRRMNMNRSRAPDTGLKNPSKFLPITWTTGSHEILNV